MAATATRQVEAEVLRRETADAPGVLLLGGRYYDYGSEPGGYWMRRLSTGALYHVRCVGGKPAGCQCGDWRYRHPAGGCRHMLGAAKVLGAC